MNMKYASLSLAATVLSKSATAQLSSRPNRLGADAKVQRKLSDESSMSMTVAFLAAAPDPAPASESGQNDASLYSSAASSKSGKSTKSTKCEQDESLVALYGKQLCPSQVKDKFTKLENTYIETRGLQNFLQPDFSTPIIDTYSSYGQIDLTQEQAESICVTKCGNEPLCGAVHVRNTLRPPGEECNAYTGKPRHSCIMINPDFGPGAYLRQVPEEVAEPVSGIVTATFLKKSSSSLPRFDLIQCNISIGTNVKVAIGCQLSQGLNPDEDTCDALLTEDWNEYMRPAVECLLNVDSTGGALNACLDCVNIESPTDVEDVCPAYAGDNTTIILDPEKCGSVCSPDDCEKEVATALLCVMGAPIIYDSIVDDFLGGSGVNRPEPPEAEGHFEAFTCPPPPVE